MGADTLEGEAIITTVLFDDRVEQQKEEYGWKFIFLGANIDAIATAAQFGIDASRASNYHADSEGTMLNFEVISEAVTHMRMDRSIAEDWKDRIEEDFDKRSDSSR